MVPGDRCGSVGLHVSSQPDSLMDTSVLAERSRAQWWMSLASIALAMALSLMRPLPVRAATITVDEGGVCTLSDAIRSANKGSTEGGCTGSSGPDTIVLDTDLVLDWSPTDISSEITILGNGHTITGGGTDNDSPGLDVESGGVVTLDSVTITGFSGFFGGIYNGGALTVTNSTISGNAATWLGGGGIYSEGALAVVNSTISGNAASNYGGGIHSNGGSLIVKSSTIVSNTANTNSGGGIYAWNSSESV